MIFIEIDRVSCLVRSGHDTLKTPHHLNPTYRFRSSSPKPAYLIAGEAAVRLTIKQPRIRSFVHLDNPARLHLPYLVRHGRPPALRWFARRLQNVRMCGSLDIFLARSRAPNTKASPEEIDLNRSRVKLSARDSRRPAVVSAVSGTITPGVQFTTLCAR